MLLTQSLTLFVCVPVGMVAVFGCSRLWSLFAGLLVAYLPSYLDGSHLAVSARDGSRFWPALAMWAGWRRIVAYFPASVCVPGGFDFAATASRGGQFVFAMHPHGTLSVDHSLVFTDSVGFMSTVAPLPRRDLGASVIFLIPGLRELCLWLGVVDAGASTAHKVLSQGFSMQLYPGGIQEQLACNSTSPCVVAKDRGGFIKLALAYDVPIVPIYVFGEDKLYDTVHVLQRFRNGLVRALRIGLPLFYGRLDSLGLLPHARPLCAVVGEPLWPDGVNGQTQQRDFEARQRALQQAADESHSTAKAAPVVAASGSVPQWRRGRRVARAVSREETAAMMDRYVDALQKLFDNNKKNHAGYENSTLRVLSAGR